LKKDIHNKLIRFGSINLSGWVLLEVQGNLLKVEEFLQGQVTSDISLLSDNCSQLSSICNHKGQVIADFIIIKNDNKYILATNNKLKDIIISELITFAKFYSVDFEIINKQVIGVISDKSSSKNSFLSNNYCKLSIEIKNNLNNFNDSISAAYWGAANKLLGNLYLEYTDAEKYRPLEINYDNLRVSFDKGCYRGQEIVARMKYLGIDRRKFCTFITEKNFKKNENIKMAGEIIEIEDLYVFNGIIKKEILSELQNLNGIIDIY
tara:strand:+ start:10198 stop:10989 length:792 start_codon:yes stop_codon:yes gene_type:complete